MIKMSLINAMMPHRLRKMKGLEMTTASSQVSTNYSTKFLTNKMFDKK